MRAVLFSVIVGFVFVVALFAQQAGSPQKERVERMLKIYRAAGELLSELEGELARKRLTAALRNDFCVYDLRAQTVLSESADFAAPYPSFHPQKPQQNSTLKALRGLLKAKTSPFMLNIKGRVVAVADGDTLRKLTKAVQTLREKHRLAAMKLRVQILLPPRDAQVKSGVTDPVALFGTSVVRDMFVNTISGKACGLFDGCQHAYVPSCRKTEKGYAPDIAVLGEGLRVVIKAQREKDGIKVELLGYLRRLRGVALKRLPSVSRDVPPPLVDVPRTQTAQLKLNFTLEKGKVFIHPLRLGQSRFWLAVRLVE